MSHSRLSEIDPACESKEPLGATGDSDLHDEPFRSCTAAHKLAVSVIANPKDAAFRRSLEGVDVRNICEVLIHKDFDLCDGMMDD